MHLGGLVMDLNKIKLGKYIEPYTEKCNIPNLTVYDVSGVNREKEFFEPSHQIGKDTSNYKIVPPKYFACNLMHVVRDIVLPIAYNHTDKNKIVSPAYHVFRFMENDEILSDYFFLYLKLPEKDRYFWFNTDSSVRDGMTWDDFIDVPIELPLIDIQQKYVDVYNAMLANQQSYERGLADLKLTCDATVEHLKKKYPLRTFSEYIERIDVRNSEKIYTNVKNVSVYKKFGEVSSKVDRNNLENYKIVMPREISFVQTTHNEKVFCNAMNNTDEPILVTSVNEVFRCDETRILPEYLCLNFNRTEFDRYARYHSWGSARETFTWADLLEVKLPIPPVKEQEYIVDIFRVLQERTLILKNMKTQIKNLCPILIKGSIEEASKSKEV